MKINRGTEIACPKCGLAQARFIEDLYEYELTKFSQKIEFLIGRVLKQGIIQLTSRCCLRDWYVQGNFYLKGIGWFPKTPPPSIGKITLQETREFIKKYNERIKNQNN